MTLYTSTHLYINSLVDSQLILHRNISASEHVDPSGQFIPLYVSQHLVIRLDDIRIFKSHPSKCYILISKPIHDIIWRKYLHHRMDREIFLMVYHHYNYPPHTYSQGLSLIEHERLCLHYAIYIWMYKKEEVICINCQHFCLHI